MTVSLNATSVLSAITTTPTAPLIEGAAAATLNATQTLNLVASAYFNFGSNLVGRFGMRATLAAPVSFLGSDFVTFASGQTQFASGSNLDTVANGGMRIYFVDGAGNHAGFNIYGSLPLYDSAGGVDGFMTQFNANNFVFSIAINRTPDVAFGAINWGNITAIEVTAKTLAASRKDFHLSRLVRRNAPSFTGTETLTSLDAAAKGATSTIADPLLMKVAPLYLRAAAQTNFNLRLGLTVGDGVTTTTFVESDFAIGFENTFEFSPGAPSHGPWVQLGPSHTRAFKVLQSATDTLNLSDGSLSAAGWWQWELSGSGAATCARLQFWRFDGFMAAHGTYTDCTWNEGASAVDVTLSTVITGGLIRDAAVTALNILSGAGNYTGLGVEINGSGATYDITLGAGGAGTYRLPNLTVPGGYTLRLRNNSATNAVTVEIPAGIAYTTTTAGGTITVVNPDVNVNIVASALIAGTRVQLYNVTDSVQILNTVLASPGLTHTVLFTGNKVVRIRADHSSKLPLETVGLLTSSGLTFLDIQAEDEVYALNAIDGSLVAEFVADGANVQVDINDVDGITNVQRLYAWLQYYMTTEAGVASQFFGAMTAIDSANYQIDQAKADIKLDNVSLSPVRVIGGNLTRRDGTTVIAATSGSIQLDPGKAYIVETGISGLTVEESAKLNAIPTAAQSAVAVWNHTQ